MRITVRLFARLRELAGTSEFERELPDDASAKTAWESLVKDYAELAEYEPVVSCAVNQEYARFSTRLSHGDEVAFLPPVSGG
jgi:molybdopterin converting factor subunit 1